MKSVIFKTGFLSLAILILCSCHNQTKRNQEWIVGEWYPQEEYDAVNDGFSNYDMTDFNLVGYNFSEDGICENKLGYFSYKSDAHLLSRPHRNENPDNWWRSSYWYRNIIRFDGNYSSYEIDGNKLRIFDLSSKTWNNKTMNFLSKDTMLLFSENDSIQEKYVRKTYNIDDEPLFDQVIFFHPYTYFANKYYYSIHRDGEFVSVGCFSGRDYVFVGEVASGEFEHLETLFKKADLTGLMKKIDNEEIGNWDPFRSVYYGFSPVFYSYVTFISAGKMYTIRDIFNQEDLFHDKEFMWAYLRGLYLPQQVQFVPETLHEQERVFSEFDGFYDLCIEKPDSILDLYHTECLYLSILLSQAKETTEEFSPMYTLKETIESEKVMETDGRYYRYMKDGKKVTLDIGFNFIEINGFDKLFRERLMRDGPIPDDFFKKWK